MRKRVLAAASAVVALAGSCPVWAATIYTNRAAFNAATTGQIVTDFEENGPGGITAHIGFSGSNFTITSAGITIYTVDPAAAGGLYDFGTGDILDVEFADTSVTVDPSVSAFGFDYAPVRTVGGEFVTINGVNYVNGAGRTLNFFGIVGTGPLGPLSIRWNGGPNIIDNFTTATVANAVPEPASWALLIAGFGAASAALRARRQRVRAAWT